jgi:hypothetical protein
MSNIIEAVQIITIWGISIIITIFSTSEYFEWENLNGYEILVELLGFIFILLGNLIYN